MNNYPEFVKVNGKKYAINTDYRIALKCNKITADPNIGDNERILSIIYLLFGDEALDDFENHTELILLAMKFLSCGIEGSLNNTGEEVKRDMDFYQDWDYISASFMSDYNIDIDNVKMHWWKFYSLLNGLSNSYDNNCCVLNRIRNLRNFDVSKIEDPKQRSEIIKAKQSIALKKEPVKLTKEQEKNMNKFYELTGIDRR